MNKEALLLNVQPALPFELLFNYYSRYYPWLQVSWLLMKKKNTFADFIACGEFLANEKDNRNEHLYAQGASAGEFLMGAEANMVSDLWHGIIAQVPFVDIINTMLDDSIPLTTNEFDEWRNPKKMCSIIHDFHLKKDLKVT